MFSYDATLLTAVQTVPQSFPDVLRILETIDATCADTDGLKWFNWVYLQVTQAVETRVAAGGFSNPAWLAELDVQFAGLFFSALRDSLSGGMPPGCWQALFQVRGEETIARIQFALAGSTRISITIWRKRLVATCEATGTTPVHGGALYQDYTGVNSTLDGLIELAKTTLHVRLPGDSLPPLTRLEGTIAAWNVSAARESAWLNAEHLWRLRGMPLFTRSFLDMLDGMTAVISKALLVPVP